MNVKRYGEMNNLSEIKDSYEVTDYLREIGVRQIDTVISIPDKSNVSLYLMNQKGWTEYTDARFNRGEPIRYNKDSVGIQNSINKGAKYIIVQGIGQLYEKPYLRNYCTNLKGRYRDMLIFQTKTSVKNFDLKDKKIAKEQVCGAEHKVGNHFVVLPDSTQFKNGETQTDSEALFGQYSVKLFKDSPYGMTHSLGQSRVGESYEISVWRKSIGEAKGGIIVSGEDFYYKEWKEVETRENGWQKMKLEFFVNSDLAGKELATYLYNPSDHIVYFDNFSIVKFKSVFDHD